MTPRGVQVWFQNRRAKTKQQAKKAEAAAAANPSTSHPPNASDASADATNVAVAASSNPPIAPRPSEGVPGDDIKDAADDASSALPRSPLPPMRSEESAPENMATADGSAPPPDATLNASAQHDNQLSNPSSESRRASLAHPLQHSPPSSAASSSALGSPTPASHANNAHVRLSTHPPSATSSYSHNHLAPTEIYSQRRTSLPPSLSSSLSGGLGPSIGVGMTSSLRRRGGYDPNARRLSTDTGGHRIVAHPYISVAQSANGPLHNLYADGEDAAYAQQQIRRPTLAQRMTAPFVSSLHSQGAQAMRPQQVLRAPSQPEPKLPSHAQRHYDISPIQVSVSHSQGYNQSPNNANGHGYDLFAPRHSIDGSALGLSQAHAQMSMSVSPLHSASSGVENDGYSMAVGMGSVPDVSRGGYAISQRPMPATLPGPLPSPNFSFGNPFAPATNSCSSSSSACKSASGTPPDASSPPLLSLRRTSEGGTSDGDTEESSGAPLSRFGSIASINGSETSWTSAYPSEEEGDICASRRMSCASEFLGMFSDLDVGSNGGAPAMHALQEQRQLRHSTSSSHLSPSSYGHQAHSPDALSAAQQQQQQQQLHASSDADGYPSPSSASTVSAGSHHGNCSSHQQHTMSHDTSQSLTTVGNGNGSRIQAQNHPRTNASSELAYALQSEPQPTQSYQQHSQPSPNKDDNAQMQYSGYGPQISNTGGAESGDSITYGYTQDHAHAEYSKAQMGHFPTVYEGYVYPPTGPDSQIPDEDASAMNDAYAAGAIELSHMCVPASESVHFLGGYVQYS
ncbi:hypothetical protein BD414DRAFT_411641 [Trametes punicea]|nr:hypothetical protein BD414DRAFT_411641 [Trametes punicea]